MIVVDVSACFGIIGIDLVSSSVPSWMTLAMAICMIVFVGLVALNLARYPPFVLYRKGFTLIDSSFWMIAFKEPRTVPFDRLVRVEFDSPGEGLSMNNLTFTLMGEEERYRPLRNGFLLSNDGLSLVNALSLVVPERLDDNVSRILDPATVGSYLEEAKSSKGPASADDIGIISMVLLPAMFSFAYLIGWFLGYVLYSYFIAERGLASFRVLSFMILGFLLMTFLFIMDVGENARHRLAKRAMVTRGCIEADLGPVTGWFLRVRRPLPLTSIGCVSIRLDDSENERYLSTTFTNGEEYVLPSEVIKHLEEHLTPGEDPFVLNNSEKGQDLEGHVVEIRLGGLVVLVLSLMLVLSLPYIRAVLL
jgi:hypothetical protein